MSLNVSETYTGGNYMSAENVTKDELVDKELTIKAVEKRQIGENDVHEKIVVSFEETERSLALNATNAAILAKALGDDAESWVGKKLSMSITKRKYQGALVDALQANPAK